MSFWSKHAARHPLRSLGTGTQRCVEGDEIGPKPGKGHVLVCSGWALVDGSPVPKPLGLRPQTATPP